MKRKIFPLFLVVALILMLCGCGGDLPKDGWWVEGRYLRGKQADLIVSGEWNVTSMSAADETVSFEGLDDGDLIRIYVGVILETWPGQTTVYAVEKMEDGDIDDISAELLEELGEMGWIDND